MATRHGCALSRELRSLPLLFLKSGKRIFKLQFRGAKFIRTMPANQLPMVQNMTDNVTPLREPGALPRLPSINVEAEQHLLGAFLCDNQLLEVVADFLRPEHFANAMHARMFEAIQKLVDRGQTASPFTLKATFNQDTALAPEKRIGQVGTMRSVIAMPAVFKGLFNSGAAGL
jgi:hypothetical protein